MQDSKTHDIAINLLYHKRWNQRIVPQTDSNIHTQLGMKQNEKHAWHCTDTDIAQSCNAKTKLSHGIWRIWLKSINLAVIIIMITLKGAVLWTVSNTYTQVARAQSCGNHMQHIMCLSCAVSHILWRDSLAIKFDRVYITFILTLFHWFKPFTNEGGDDTRVPAENPKMNLRKWHILKPKNSNLNQDSNPHFSIGSRRL